MKYGIVVSVSKTKFGLIVFKENLYENLVKVKELGYDGVELAIRKPESIDVDKVKKLIQEHDLTTIAIATGQIYCEEGLSFSDNDKTIREESVKRIKPIIDIASYFNSSVIIGLIRGKISSLNDFGKKLEIAEERIYECLSECLSYSRNNSVNFLLEPINRYETNIFNKLEDVNNFLMRYKNKLDTNRIGILADTFHMNIEEPAIHISIHNYLNLIEHIHFADSNRLAPGFGHIDFYKIMNVLEANDYNGFISFEMLSLPDPDTAAKKAIDYVRSLEKKKPATETEKH